MNILPEDIIKNCLEIPGKFVTQFEQPAGKANTFIEKCLSCYFPWDCLTFSFFLLGFIISVFFKWTKIPFHKNTRQILCNPHIHQITVIQQQYKWLSNVKFPNDCYNKVKSVWCFSFTKQIFIHEKERWWWKDIIQMYAFFTIPMMNMYPGSGRPINSLLYII